MSFKHVLGAQILHLEATAAKFPKKMRLLCCKCNIHLLKMRNPFNNIRTLALQQIIFLICLCVCVFFLHLFRLLHNLRGSSRLIRLNSTKHSQLKISFILINVQKLYLECHSNGIYISTANSASTLSLTLNGVMYDTVLAR